MGQAFELEEVSDMELASLDSLLLTAEAHQEDQRGSDQAAARLLMPAAPAHRKEDFQKRMSTCISASGFDASQHAVRQAASLTQPAVARQPSALNGTFKSQAKAQAQQHANSARPLCGKVGGALDLAGEHGSRQTALQPQSTCMGWSGASSHFQQVEGAKFLHEQGGLGQIAEPLWPATVNRPCPYGRSSCTHQQHSIGLSCHLKQQQGGGNVDETLDEMRSAQELHPSACAGQPSSFHGPPLSLQQHPLRPHPLLQQPPAHEPAEFSVAAAHQGQPRSMQTASFQPAVDARNTEQSAHNAVPTAVALRVGSDPGHVRKQRSGRRLPASMDASQPQPPSKSKMPFLTFIGRTVYPTTSGDINHHCERLLASGCTVVGMDTEWRVTYRANEAPRRTALLQICYQHQQTVPRDDGAVDAADYTCLLLPIFHTGIPVMLGRLLANQDIAKAGVGILGDAHKLQRDYGAASEGLWDIYQHLQDRADNPVGGRGLASLTSWLLKQQLDKSDDVRCSNWEASPLSPRQQAYAAADAYASLRLCQVLMAMPLRPRPDIPVPSGLPAASSKTQQTGQAVPQLVPAVAQPAKVQPAMQTVYNMFTEQAMSIEAIAAARRVQRDTVESYLAECITAGLAYDWQRMAVTDAMRDRIHFGLASLFKQHALQVTETSTDCSDNGNAQAASRPKSGCSNSTKPLEALDHPSSTSAAASPKLPFHADQRPPQSSGRAAEKSPTRSPPHKRLQLQAARLLLADKCQAVAACHAAANQHPHDALDAPHDALHPSQRPADTAPAATANDSHRHQAACPVSAPQDPGHSGSDCQISSGTPPANVGHGSAHHFTSHAADLDCAASQGLAAQQASVAESGPAAGPEPEPQRHDRPGGLPRQGTSDEDSCKQPLESSQQGSCAIRDPMAELTQRGLGIRDLKETLPEVIRWGQIRLAVAHIGRTGLIL
ncbi:hypothetical protein WJX74_008364 [Apatococcus lobatus]|uniref:3'-5' exonuclease n=1 Tax=Apatococcus lobatus TaxID=904363 RepID=A0AAW1RWD0_9CHLO